MINIFVLDMDECGASKSICDVNAECENTLGSFKCLCKTGFTGNGLVCNGKFTFC